MYILTCCTIPKLAMFKGTAKHNLFKHFNLLCLQLELNIYSLCLADCAAVKRSGRAHEITCCQCFKPLHTEIIWQIKNTALNLLGYINKTSIVAYSSHQTKTNPMTIRHTKALGC